MKARKSSWIEKPVSSSFRSVIAVSVTFMKWSSGIETRTLSSGSHAASIHAVQVPPVGPMSLVVGSSMPEWFTQLVFHGACGPQGKWLKSNPVPQSSSGLSVLLGHSMSMAMVYSPDPLSISTVITKVSPPSAKSE